MTHAPRELDIVQLKPATAKHCGFKFGQVTQVNDDSSLYVTGKIGDGGQWFVAADQWQVPKNYEIERLRIAMTRAADMLPANAACGVLRHALKEQE